MNHANATRQPQPLPPSLRLVLCAAGCGRSTQRRLCRSCVHRGNTRVREYRERLRSQAPGLVPSRHADDTTEAP